MGARKLETWPIFILHKILMVSLADPGRQRAERLLKGQRRRERGRDGELRVIPAGAGTLGGLETNPHSLRGSFLETAVSPYPSLPMAAGPRG